MKRLLPGVLFTPALLAAALAVGCNQTQDKPKPLPEVERPAKADQAPAADVKAAARGNNDFAFDLHRRMAADGNLFVSPFSVSTALSMTYAGAKGDTAAEMARALHYPFEGERLHLGYAGLLGKLSGDGRPAGVQLSVANALWGPHDYNQDFLDINRDCYAARVRKIALAGAEPTINQWAAEHTAGRIKDLLPPGSLDPDSVLVLTNAVYFKGEWEHRFKESDTQKQAFRVKKGEEVQVPTMHQTAKFRYAETGKGESAAQVLELPYKGGDLSMVIVLPRADDGVAAVERALTAEKLDGWLDQASATDVRVSLPRFKIEGATVNLNDPLKSLGMKKAFAAGADFTGMVPNGGVWIDKVLHQAFVEVNEEGSEAAAATAVVMTKDGGPPREHEPVAFTADHPFLFLIRDNRTDCVLFLGRLSNPK